MTSFGVMFRRDWAPELLRGFAQATEAAGFDELWVVEDLGYHGGFSQSAAALAATERITVGLGIAPAVARNAAFLAMEIATTHRMFPGRFHMGLGHGVESWIDQAGARPVSWLAALDEVTSAAKRIVAGEEVTFDGRHVRLDHLTLVHPVTGTQPLVSLGVRQPKSIALSREVADGVVLAECSGPIYIAQTRAALGPDRRITLFVNASTDVEGSRVEVDRRISQGRFESQMACYEGMDIDLAAEVSISGPIDTWAAHIERLVDAGADSVVFVALVNEAPDVLDDYAAALRHLR